MSSETLQNRCKTKNENRRTVSNNPNQSLLWDGIDLPPADLWKSYNSPLEKEVKGIATYQVDSFLEENNQFLLEIDELIKHHGKQVASEREKFMKEVEEKYKKKKLN